MLQNKPSPIPTTSCSDILKCHYAPCDNQDFTLDNNLNFLIQGYAGRGKGFVRTIVCTYQLLKVHQGSSH